MAKISIIIPCLNVARYIRECMDSAINQTIRDIEIIVIDGGSTDGTVAILEEYAQKDGRILLLHSDIKSYGHQVNMGFDRACGEYVAVLESDDYVDLSMYEILSGVADQNQTDITKADFDRFYTLSNGYKEFTTVRFWQNEPDNYDKVLYPRDHRILFCNDYFLWKGIYRRQFIEDNHIRFHETPGAAFQDIGFLQQVMAAAKRVIYTKDSFYRYRTDRDESSSYSPKVLKYGYDEFSWLLKMHDQGLRELYLPGLCSHMMSAFTGETWVSLMATGFDMESEYIRPYYDWFKSTIGEFVDDGVVGFDEVYDVTVEQFMEIYEHVDEYIIRRKAEIEAASKTVGRGLETEQLAGMDVVIFGSGQRGQTYIRQIDGIANICAIADNNQDKWNSTCLGYTILSPGECVSAYSDALYVIAIKGHEEEIKSQLLELGIDEHSILM